MSVRSRISGLEQKRQKSAPNTHQWIPATETIREFEGVANAELNIMDGIGVYFPLSVAEDMMDWIVGRWRGEVRG